MKVARRALAVVEGKLWRRRRRHTVELRLLLLLVARLILLST